MRLAGPPPRRTAAPPSPRSALRQVRARLERMWIDERNAIEVVEESPPGRVSMPCNGRLHTARVGDDGFVLESHDIDAECALLALGAPMPTCLVYAWIWQHAFEDESFMVDWADDADRAGLARTREDWLGNYWESWPADPNAARALFGPELQDRLGGACARKWAGTGPATAGGSAARRAVQTRARRAAVLSLASVTAHRRPDALVPMSIRVGGAGAPSIAGRLALDGSGVDIILAMAWLWEVWAEGMAVYDGRFVLGRMADTFLTVSWEPTGDPHREHAPRIRPTPFDGRVTGVATTR